MGNTHSRAYWLLQIFKFKTSTQELAQKVQSLHKVQMREWAVIDFMITHNFTIDDFRKVLAHEIKK